MSARPECATILRFIFFLMIGGLLGSPTFAEAGLQDDAAVVYLRYDVDIEVREDGSFHVREEQEILFNEAFRTAFAEIPLELVTEIRNIAVSEGPMPYEPVNFTPSRAGTYFVSYEQDSVLVDWMYEETAPGETRVFVIEYDVIGGLWVYEDGDILEWRALPADRSGVPVNSSTVTVTLPQQADAGSLETFAFGPPYDVTVEDGRAIFTAEGGVDDGTAFQIMVGFPHSLVDATVQAWQRAEDSAELAYHIPSVEVTLAISEGGAVQVTERQRVAVEEGVLYGGERIIPLAYADGLTGFAVSEGEAPFALVERYDPDCEACAWVEERSGTGPWIRLNREMGTLAIDEEAAGEVYVGWSAPPLVRGEETTFVVRYTAMGALQVTEESQRLVWTPISGFGVPVEAAHVVVGLPPGVAAQDVSAEGGEIETAGDGRLLIHREGGLAAGESWQVRITLPAGATAAAVPIWQQEMAEVAEEAAAIQEEFRQQEIRRARQQLAFGVGSVVLLLGGLLLAGLIWYLWGRDSAEAVAPAYLSEPPSDLPPGIVAYLLDEKATPKGVLASLFHLASLGLLRIDLSEPLKLARNWDEELVEGQEIETPEGGVVTIPGHMVLLFNGLREQLAKEPAPLSQIAPQLPQIIPQVYYAMGQEATLFFERAPEDARRRWLVVGQWIVLGGAGLALAAALFYVPQLGWVAALPAAALVVAGAALIVISRWMPQRSAAGVEEAARWRAFEQYLRNLQQYGDQEDAQRILDRHFAYAVALDVEEVVLAQAETMEASMPTWTRPVLLHGPRRRPGAPSTTSAQGPLRRGPALSIPREASKLPGASREGAGGAARGFPSLSGMADALASQIERANAGLTHTLQNAVGDVDDTPFQMVWRGARGAGRLTMKASMTSLEIMEAILDEASSGGGGTSYRGSSGGSSGGSSRSSWGSSRSSGSSRRSSSSSRSSSSRRSGGGGRRGFGR